MPLKVKTSNVKSCINVVVSVWKCSFKTDKPIEIKTFKICFQSLKSDYVEDKYPYICQR